MIKYIKGLPTKKSIFELIEEFGDYNFFGTKPCTGYGGYGGNYLIWSRLQVQARIEEFIQFGTDKGILFGYYQPYDSKNMKVGKLEILKK